MSKNKKKILITGGAGFVGTNLINLFLKKTKFNIISLDNYSSGTKKNHIKNKRIKYIKGHTKNIARLIRIYLERLFFAFSLTVSTTFTGYRLTLIIPPEKNLNELIIIRGNLER